MGAIRRDQIIALGGDPPLFGGDLGLPDSLATLAQEPAKRGEEAVDPGVVEAARDRPEDREILVPRVEELAVAADLLADVAEGVLRPLVLKLVDGDEIRDVEHLDLLELARRAVLGGHHIEGHVCEALDRGVALADPRGLDDHHVVACELAEADRVVGRRGELRPRGARRHAPHVGPGRPQRVHPDPIAEQRAAGAPPRRVDGDHGDPTIGMIAEQP